jgi:hypothetical protein
LGDVVRVARKDDARKARHRLRLAASTRQ